MSGAARSALEAHENMSEGLEATAVSEDSQCARLHCHSADQDTQNSSLSNGVLIFSRATCDCSQAAPSLPVPLQAPLPTWADDLPSRAASPADKMHIIG